MPDRDHSPEPDLAGGNPAPIGADAHGAQPLDAPGTSARPNSPSQHPLRKIASGWEWVTDLPGGPHLRAPRRTSREGNNIQGHLYKRTEVFYQAIPGENLDPRRFTSTHETEDSTTRKAHAIITEDQETGVLRANARVRNRPLRPRTGPISSATDVGQPAGGPSAPTSTAMSPSASSAPQRPQRRTARPPADQAVSTSVPRQRSEVTQSESVNAPTRHGSRTPSPPGKKHGYTQNM
jgi:hypothetical protein